MSALPSQRLKRTVRGLSVIALLASMAAASGTVAAAGSTESSQITLHETGGDQVNIAIASAKVTGSKLQVKLAGGVSSYDLAVLGADGSSISSIVLQTAQLRQTCRQEFHDVHVTSINWAAPGAFTTLVSFAAAKSDPSQCQQLSSAPTSWDLVTVSQQG